jgi:hypothetical protein
MQFSPNYLITMTAHIAIHVEVESKTWKDYYEGTEVMTRTVLSTSSRLTHNFTILCGTWTLLNARKPGPHLIEEIVETCRTQKELESTDHRTSARYVLRDLKKDT